MPALKLRFCSLLLCCCVFFASLSGCASGCLEQTSAFQYFNPTTMELAGEYPCQYPVMRNISREKAVNTALYEYYAPVLELIRQANGERGILYIGYTLLESEESKSIQSAIYSVYGDCMPLPDITLSGGKILLPELPELAFLADGQLAAAYMRLCSIGMEIDLTAVSQPITNSELYALMTGYYEALRGEPVDTSLFVGADAMDINYMKALELGLCDDDTYSYYSSDQALCTTLAAAAAGLYERVGTDCYGCGSQLVSLDRLMDTVVLFMRLFTPHGDVSDSWYELIETVSATDMTGIYYQEINRQGAADAFVRCYETGFNETIKPDSYMYEYITDTADDIAIKANYASLLDEYPSNGLLSTECDVFAYQLPSMALDFAQSCFYRWQASTGFSADTAVTTLDVLYAIVNIDRAFDEFELCTERVRVINDRDYDWYLTQYNTGPYSSVNCMPTIATMAVLWYSGPQSDVSVSGLREMFLPEYDGGWYMSQVLDSLDEYSVPYTRHETFDDTMMQELDEGHIILTQMSEAGYGESGHCFVIYGYEKTGDTVTYFVHDPDVYDGVDFYGKEPGRTMRLNSSYMYWIINRIAIYYISVGDYPTE